MNRTIFNTIERPQINQIKGSEGSIIPSANLCVSGPQSKNRRREESNFFSESRDRTRDSEHRYHDRFARTGNNDAQNNYYPQRSNNGKIDKIIEMR